MYARAVLCLCLAALPAFAAGPDPFGDIAPAPAAPERPGGLFDGSFTLKKEIFSQFSYDRGAEGSVWERTYSRQSVGFEALKKFSTRTSTVASVDLQVRLVRRDRFVETSNDMEGHAREDWFLEYHNAYADFYNLAGDPGRLNFRIGRFYLPFGLNLQTDTHGTVLQLSNERNFGFERDWYAGFWGTALPGVNYDAYYLVGSGYDLSFRGQSGMAGTRLSLANRFLNDFGFEGGVSFLGGQRIDRERDEGIVTDTRRVGVDARLTRPVPTGSMALTGELSGGRDDEEAVRTALWQLDYLTARRQWGLSGQYRRFWQELPRGMDRADASLSGEFAWYFRNDPGGAFLHSLRLNVERRLERQSGPESTVWTLQFYRYW